MNQAATGLVPRDPRPHVNLGGAYYHLQQWQDAIDHFTTALALDPSKAHVLVNRGNAKLQLKQVESALADFEAAIQLNPANDDLRSKCAMLSFQRGDDRRALAHFQNLLQRHPNSPDLEGPIAWILASASEDGLRNGAEAVRLGVVQESGVVSEPTEISVTSASTGTTSSEAKI